MKAYLLWILALSARIFLESIGVPPYYIGRLFGLSPRNLHILKERARMNRRLWLKIMYRDNWICYLCGAKAQEVDHVRPLAAYGKTEERNLKACCRRCNRAKGARY